MKKIKFFYLVLMLVVFILKAENESYAYGTFNRHKFINGVGNYGQSMKYYYVDGSASSETLRIESIMNKWVNSNGTGIYTPISFRRTTTKSSSVIDTYKSSQNLSNYLGVTYFYDRYSNDINMWYNDWAWSKIVYYNMYNQVNYKIKNIATAHEIGHAFGLAHTGSGNQYSLMNSNAAVILDYYSEPRHDEFNGINYLYK